MHNYYLNKRIIRPADQKNNQIFKMPSCIVADCDSGSFRQERRSKLLSERVAFFNFPKDPELANKWTKALKLKKESVRLKEQRVCQKHFCDKDIIKFDEIPLVNGEIWRSERHHYKLEYGAVPFYSPPEMIVPDILESIKTKVDDNNTCESITQEDVCVKSYLSKMSSPRDDQNCSVANLIEQHVPDTINEQIINPKSVMRRYTANGKTIQHTKLCRNTMFHSPEQMNQRVPNNLDNQENRAPTLQDTLEEDIPRKSLLNDHQYLSYADFRQTVVPHQTKLVKDYFNPKGGEEAPAEESCTSNIDSENFWAPNHDEVIQDQAAEVVELPFKTLLEPSQSTLDNIMDFLRKTPLPRTWSWMKFTRKDNGFTFTQIDCTYRIIRVFVELYEDLSIKVITGDGKASAKVRVELSSLNSIIDALYSIEKMQVCMGTGDDNSSPVRDDNCCGLVLRNEPKQLRPYGRCATCQKSRLKLKMKQQLKKTSTRTTDTYTRCEELKKEVKLLKRKCKYYEDKTNMQSKKIKTMVEMIKTVNESNSEKKYELL